MLIAGCVAVPVGAIVALGLGLGGASDMSFVTAEVVISLGWMVGALLIFRLIDQQGRIPTIIAVISFVAAAVVFQTAFWAQAARQYSDPIADVIGALVVATIVSVLVAAFLLTRRASVELHESRLWIGTLAVIVVVVAGAYGGVRIVEGPGYPYGVGDQRYGSCEDAIRTRGVHSLALRASITGDRLRARRTSRRGAASDLGPRGQ